VVAPRTAVGSGSLIEAGLISAEGGFWPACRVTGILGLRRPSLIPARLGVAALRALRKLTLAGFARLGLAVFAFSGFAEVVDFFVVEFTDLAGFEVEDERAIADAANFLDVMPNLFEHLAQFSIAAFNENNLIPGIVDGT